MWKNSKEHLEKKKKKKDVFLYKISEQGHPGTLCLNSLSNNTCTGDTV